MKTQYLDSVPNFSIQQIQNLPDISQTLICSKHKKPAKMMCVTTQCNNRRLLCAKCLNQIQTFHHLNSGHQTKQISQVYKQLNQILLQRKKQNNQLREKYRMTRQKIDSKIKQAVRQRIKSEINVQLKSFTHKIKNQLENYEKLFDKYKSYYSSACRQKQEQYRQKIRLFVNSDQFINQQNYSKKIKKLINKINQIQNRQDIPAKFKEYLKKCQKHYKSKQSLIEQAISKISLETIQNNIQNYIKKNQNNDLISVKDDFIFCLVPIYITNLEQSKIFRKAKHYQHTQLIFQFNNNNSLNDSQNILQELSDLQFQSIQLRLIDINLINHHFPFNKLAFPLKRLEYQIQHCKLTASHLQNIQVYIQNFSKSQKFHLLTHFSLLLQQNDISLIQIQIITNIIKFFKKITHFKIYSRKNIISKNQITILCKSILQISGLEALSLLFEGKNSIQDHGFKQIINVIKFLSKTLKEISISLRANNLTNKSIEYFRQNLIFLKDLKYLKLNISSNINITQQSLINLIQQISQFQIEVLHLDMSFLQLSKQFIKSILNILKRHTTLKILKIEYYSLWLNAESRSQLKNFKDQQYRNSGINVQLIF